MEQFGCSVVRSFVAAVGWCSSESGLDTWEGSRREVNQAAGWSTQGSFGL